MFETILQCIKAYDTIVIHRHTNPDGDALGAQMGLKQILLDSFPQKRVYAVGDGTSRYAFMANGGTDEIDDSVYTGALAIILDTSAKSLISDKRYLLAQKRARIDHHIFCETIAECEVTDTSFESCCGMIAAFAMEAGLTVSASAAKALYTGMITDSGRFRYDSTTADTLRRAAFLLERGFDTADIYRNLYADDFSFIRLRAEFVLKIRFTKRRVAYIYTTAEEARATGKDLFSISRGMVNVMSDIRGTDIWVNFTEGEEGVLCEMRSGLYNVNPVAQKYGGGGHAKASGATLKDRDEAMRLLADLEALIGEERV